MKKRIMNPGIIAAVLTAVVLLTACGGEADIPGADTETQEVVIVIPSESRSILSSLISEYENAHTDISVKLVNIGGTTEKIHSFFVSALMDSKFSADMLIIDDIWLSEFAGAGLVSEISGMDDYKFIPAAKKGMMYGGKVYGVSLYADVMTSFRKKRSESGRAVCFAEDVNDVSAYIRNEIVTGETAENSYRKYSEIEKIDNVSQFVEQDAEIMYGWLSQYDTMQKYYPVDASYTEINIGENNLIKSKLAIINSESSVKETALDIIRYLLTEKSQIEIMNNITSISVMSEDYSDPIMLDRFPYLGNVSGKNFSTFPFIEDYNIRESELKKCIESDAELKIQEDVLEYLSRE